MATTGKFNGDLLVISVGGTTIAHSQDATLSVSMDTPDATTKDSAGWVDVISGNKSWEMSATGLLTYDATLAPDDLFDDLVAGDDVTVLFSTGVSGDIEYTGSAKVSSVSQNAPQNAPVSYDVTLTGNGVLTKQSVT